MIYVRETGPPARRAEAAGPAQPQEQADAEVADGRGAGQGALEDLDAAGHLDVSAGQRESAVFGGSGFYRLLDDVEEVAVDTPYGPPSARVRLGEIEGTRVAFMPRHGDEHTLPPHRINYRANVWAMRERGRAPDHRALAPAARCKPELTPGTFVICDQFVDRTRGREDTFYDGPADHPRVGRRPLLRRVCARTLVQAARERGNPGGDRAARWW